MRALVALFLAVSLTAQAAPVKGRLAIVPLRGAGGAPLPPIEALLASESQRQPEMTVVAAGDVKQTLRRLKRKELDDCDGEAACLAAIGKALGVAWVMSGEATPLPEGQVVYLKLVEVEGAREVASTTAVIDPKAATARTETRAAVIRLLRPDAYLGSLALKLDVTGANVFVDGKRVSGTTIPLTVGTHAVRVTHPQYRDFVRFVDVGFDQKVAIDVELKRYPIVADAMRQDRRDLTPVEPIRAGPVLPRPWYREWWAVAALGAVVLVGTATITYYTDPGVTADQDVTVDDR